jgi:hypothetical protein
MSGRRCVQRSLASVATLCAAVVWAGCLGDGADEAPSAGRAAADQAVDVTLPQARRPFVRGCRSRAEGGRLVARRGRDTVIGPLAFPYLAESYREAARPDSRRSAPPGDFNAHPVKALALVRSGTRVTLSVPPVQRSWMQLLYHPSAVWRGSLRVTLQACRRQHSRAGRRTECGWRPYTACRWRNTQFNGAIYVDFDRAPHRGRCARLVVHIGGKEGRSNGGSSDPRRARAPESRVAREAHSNPRAAAPQPALSRRFVRAASRESGNPCLAPSGSIVVHPNERRQRAPTLGE